MDPRRHDSFTRPVVVVIGAACLDVKGQVFGEPVQHTSNAGNIRISIGGCARNIAENLARLGTPTALLTALCQDDFGRTIISRTERAGVNTDHVRITCDQYSASYIALLNTDGNLLMGIDDTRAIEAITPDYIDEHQELLNDTMLVMLDANVPRESIEVILNHCRNAGVPVGFDPVAYGPATRYRDLIGAFALVTPNALEAQALTGIAIASITDATRAAKHLVGQGVGTAIITMADRGVVYATSNISGHVPALPVDVLDATGASDALTATVLYGLVNDIPIDEAIRLGVSAAALTLGSTETVRQDMNLENLYARMLI